MKGEYEKIRIENWLMLGSELEGLIPLDKFEKNKFVVCGRVYGDPKFLDGTLVTTSEISTLGNDKKITSSEGIYELGNMHSDYVKFLNAIEKGIPILKRWTIEKHLFNGSLTGYQYPYFLNSISSLENGKNDILRLCLNSATSICV